MMTDRLLPFDNRIEAWYVVVVNTKGVPHERKFDTKVRARCGK